MVQNGKIVSKWTKCKLTAVFFIPLSRLVRMSRSKGGAIMLVSQSPDDFSGEDDEFLDQMGIVAAFSTNARPRSAARILGKRVNLTRLDVGQCFARRRGDPSALKVIAWE